VLNYLANAISPSNAHMFYKYNEKRDYGVEEPEIFAVYDRIILSKLCAYNSHISDQPTQTVEQIIFQYQ
jgi:hypothetical protein